MAWYDSLLNASLKSAASTAVNDGSVTFSEMLNLLSLAASGGVSASELSDLKSVYSNFSPNFSSNYLKSITYSVVYDNPGNAKWWGGTSTLSSVAPLGNLQADSSETVANRLIGKWFLGTDLPMPIAGGDTATGKAATRVFSYATASGPLTVNGVAATDINQGAAGDCYLMAALGAIANARPTVINNMFTPNSNGTYGVTFYKASAPVYSTVNNSLAVNTSGKLALAGDVNKSLSGELWVSLAEKAYTQLNTQFDVDNNGSQWNGENSYQAIEGGLAQAIKQVANVNYRYYSSYYQGFGDSYDSGEFYSANASTYKQALISGLNAGAIGWIGSWGNTTGSNGKQEFVAGHAFMLLAYNASTDKFVVRNPWGGSGTSYYNIQFEVSIETFWNSSVKALVALSDASIADPSYNYTLSSSASASTSAINEGSAIVFTITRSGSGTSSTVYLDSVDGSAGSADYAAFADRTVTFAANETVKTISVSTYSDALIESTENFSVALYKNAADTSSAATATAFIKDVAVTSYGYTVASSAATIGNAALEGQNITFTITRTGTGTGTASTVYLSTLAGTAGSLDYSALTKQALDFSTFDTSKTITVITYKDALNESVESFSLNLFKSLSDATATASATAYIADAVDPLYDYVLVSNAGSSGAGAAEGGKVTFTITRGGTGTASTVYLSTLAATAGITDYLPISKTPVTFSANQSIATLQVDVTQDWWLEPVEYFRLGLYQNQTDTVARAYATSYIKDVLVGSYNYTIGSSAGTAATAVPEGAPVTFTVTRSGSGTASTVYVATASGTAIGGSDYATQSRQAVTFGATETSKNVTVATYQDSLTEGNEYFWLNLYRNASDTTRSTYATAYIKDVVLTDYAYTLTSNASSATTAATEGGSVTFTISRSASGSASTVYVSTSNGSALGGSDFTALTRQAIDFGANDTSKTVTVAAYQDDKTEATEYFWLELYKNYADTTTATYGSAYIKDIPVVSYSYKVSSNAATSSAAVIEGNDVTFTITRTASGSGVGSASTVYVSTSDGSAYGDSDFASINLQSVTFGANETSKTVTVKTLADSTTESPESFWLDLYKNYTDSTETTSGLAYIKDVPVISYTYSVTSNATVSNPVTEGGTVTFTIIRSASGSASTVYVATSNGTAQSGSDYIALSRQAVTFAANETSQTISVTTKTDSLSEGKEYFWLDLYKNATDTNWIGYRSAYIKDPVVAALSLAAEPELPLHAAATNASSLGPVASASSSLLVLPGHTEAEYQNQYAFAALKANGSVVSWGDNASGGDTSAVAAFLDGVVRVTRIYSNAQAFSALRADGSVITWGKADAGGSSAAVASGISGVIDVTDIAATKLAFAALRQDGSVLAWGDGRYGGDISAVANALNGSVPVAKVYSNSLAFAALRTDGSVVTWGLDSFGGNSSAVATSLNGTIDVSRVFSSQGAFAALRTDGSVVTWGATGSGGDSSTVSTQLDGVLDVTAVSATQTAMAALRADGSVVAWGNSIFGGDSSAVANSLNGELDVVSLSSTGGAFAALRSDGSVITWGYDLYGGNSAKVAAELKGTEDVISVLGNNGAFAAIRTNGSVIAWGSDSHGGDTSSVSAQLDGSTRVVQLYASNGAFAALRFDGSVVTWGDLYAGGDSSAVASQLNGAIPVSRIVGTGGAFMAVRMDGSVVSWGDTAAGGDSGSRSTSLQSVVGGAMVDATGVNWLTGSGNIDALFGTVGNDTLYGRGGNDSLNGGAGTDTALYYGNRASYTTTKTATGWTVSSAAEGLDTLTNIERLKFADTTLALDLAGNAGTTAKILGAVFGRASVSNKAYMGIGLDYLDNQSYSYAQLMQLALDARLGPDASYDAVVDLLYSNVVGVLPGTAEHNYYVGLLNAKTFTPASLGVLAAETTENTLNINLLGLVSTGIDYSV
jgi:alpha-tubulin suppressor-like RCC1 family protein